MLSVHDVQHSYDRRFHTSCLLPCDVLPLLRDVRLLPCDVLAVSFWICLFLFQ